MAGEIINIVSWIFIFAGAFFVFTGALGILRMPDFFTRLHPAGIIDAMGAPCVFIGVAMQNGFTLFTGKIAILTIFLFITSPTASHTVAKSALINGLKPFQKGEK